MSEFKCPKCGLEHDISPTTCILILDEENKRLRKRTDKCKQVLTDLLQRIDLNGGLGEYSTGAAFVMKDARDLLKTL